MKSQLVSKMLDGSDGSQMSPWIREKNGKKGHNFNGAHNFMVFFCAERISRGDVYRGYCIRRNAVQVLRLQSSLCHDNKWTCRHFDPFCAFHFPTEGRTDPTNHFKVFSWCGVGSQSLWGLMFYTCSIEKGGAQPGHPWLKRSLVPVLCTLLNLNATERKLARDPAQRLLRVERHTGDSGLGWFYVGSILW